MLSAYVYLITECEIPAEKVIFSGDSAGGNIVISTLLFIRRFQHQIESLLQLPTGTIQMPKAAILISPFLDLTGSGLSSQLNRKIDYIEQDNHMQLLTRIYAEGRDQWWLPIATEQRQQETDNYLRTNLFLSPALCADMTFGLPPILCVSIFALQ